MANEKIHFACTSCSAVNWVDLEPIKEKVGKVKVILICGTCGRVNLPQKIEKSNDPKHINMNYLPCIEFTGAGRDLPTGYVTSGGRTLWTDANAKSWTTEEFILRYGVDPRVAWRNIILQQHAFQQAIQMGHPSVATYRVK